MKHLKSHIKSVSLIRGDTQIENFFLDLTFGLKHTILSILENFSQCSKADKFVAREISEFRVLINNSFA